MKKIVAVTGCPTGIAHTYMAEEALKKAEIKAQDLNDELGKTVAKDAIEAVNEEAEKIPVTVQETKEKMSSAFSAATSGLFMMVSGASAVYAAFKAI